MLFLAAAAACLLDLFVVSPEQMTVPFAGYAIVLVGAVALQFVGSALPKMRFSSKKSDSSSEKPGKDLFVIK